MTKIGLVFLMNEKPKKDERFILKKKYRFIPSFSKRIKTIIELEIYPNRICVISFYEDKKGTDKTKYKLRSNIGAGHTKAIFKACLDAYYSLDGDYALVFSASNDIGNIQENNVRYSAYLLFLSIHFKNYKHYDKLSSIALNTFMLYHRSFQYKEEADIFYEKFEDKVKRTMND